MPDLLMMPEKIHEYLLAVSLREPPLLKKLRLETAAMPNSQMQIAPEYGQFMALLIQLMGARRTLEVGVFTGYSSLAVALALPPEGRIVACDVSEEFTAVARRYWKEAGVDHMIDLQLRPAMETLKELMREGQRGTFDFAFIDADKPSYEGYYECALELLRPGGVVMIDNVLWSGRVCDEEDQTANTVALRTFNQKLLGDTRVTLSMLSIGDGATLALKR
ncbi:MAG TPA: class I SAM-dependent methyltransferase [Bryobacteraceae bacterium]|jgi:caffeoyl-CoA O-methyltransferase